MPMTALESKVCRMMLTSRMILSDEQQKLVCEGKDQSIHLLEIFRAVYSSNRELFILYFWQFFIIIQTMNFFKLLY